MTKRSRFLHVQAIFTTLLSVAVLSADAEEPKRDGVDQAAVFMRAKLASSQKVIEGLVTEDFDLIRKAALDMQRMSEAANWPTAQDKSYEHYREVFRRECEQLAGLAKTENLAGAHYTYLHLTTTCINCHNYVRKSFRVSRDKSNPKGPVMLIPNQWEGSAEGSSKEAAHIIDSRPK